MPYRTQTQALADAMAQLLDDMGTDGLCVCKFAKAKARVVYEPFLEIGEDVSGMMPLDDALKIISEIEEG